MTPKKKSEILEKKGMIFPEKHRKALKNVALICVLEAKEKHPDWNLNQTLAALVKDFNPDMPPQFLLEYTQHIVHHWVALEEKEKKALAA